MNISYALHALLNGTATEEGITLHKHLLASGNHPCGHEYTNVDGRDSVGLICLLVTPRSWIALLGDHPRTRSRMLEFDTAPIREHCIALRSL